MFCISPSEMSTVQRVFFFGNVNCIKEFFESATSLLTSLVGHGALT